jgi:hypothetical protein
MPATTNINKKGKYSHCPKCRKTFQEEDYALGCNGTCEEWSARIAWALFKENSTFSN